MTQTQVVEKEGQADIRIPMEDLMKLGIKPGDSVEVHAVGQHIELVPVVPCKSPYEDARLCPKE